MSKERINTLLVSTFSEKHGAAAAESLGAETLAGHLLGEREKEVTVDHIDLQLDELNTVKKIVWRKQPDILGISVKIGSLGQVENLMEDVGNKVPMVVMGGPVATFAGQQLIEKYPNAIMVIGEGEPPITGLVDVVKGKRGIESVPGIMYVDEDGNLVVTQRQRHDLSKRHLPARITTKRIWKEINGLVWAEASRGCDGHCTFCSIRELHGGGFEGEIPTESVVDDLQTLKDMGVTVVNFADDDFCGGGIDRTVRLAQRIAQEVPGIQYTISTRADHIWAEKLPPYLRGRMTLEEYNQQLRKMVNVLAESGLVRVFIGLESGSPSQLRRYGKQISVEGNYRAIEILRQEGIDVVAGFIPIDPLMTLEELKENLSFLKKTGMYLKISNPLSVLRVQAGSPYLRMLENRGLVGQPTEDLVFYEASFENPKVEIVARLANQWVTDLYVLVFGLKNEAARVVEGRIDGDALLAKTIIEELRELEMEFLESITDCMLEGGKVEKVVNDFLARRNGVVTKIKQAVEVGRFERSNRRLREAVRQIL